MKKLWREIKGQVNLERDLFVDRDNLDKATGECIVDFVAGNYNGLAVSGKIVDDEIVIDDNAVVYNPEEQ